MPYILFFSAKISCKMTSTKDLSKTMDTLPSIFAKGLSLHSELCSDSEDPQSDTFQTKVRQGIMILEDATRMVSVLDLFSRNETVSDLPTNTLKFFLLPVLLGGLFCSKFTLQ